MNPLSDITATGLEPDMAKNEKAFEDDKLRQLDRLATLLDSQYKIPGTNMRVGLDGLIGLIPGIGDAATTALSLYIVARSKLRRIEVMHPAYDMECRGQYSRGHSSRPG